jgi:hypothetical protein
MRSPRSVVVLALVAAVAAPLGCASAPRERPIPTSKVATGAGTVEGARDFLQGRWSLLAFEVYPPGRDPIVLQGAGTMVYDDFGNLNVEIRVGPAGAGLLEQAGISTDQGVLSSSGRVVVDMPGRTLTYVLPDQPPTGAPSGPLALNRPRHWEVEGDVLTLTTKDGNGALLSMAKWQRGAR